MNLFRSEEHARNWDGYDDAMAAALMPVADWADIFSNSFFKERGRPDYMSWVRGESGAAAFAELRRRLPHTNGT